MANFVSVVKIIIELIWLNLKIWFYIGEAVFRTFVPPPNKDIRGKVVLITGAYVGIRQSSVPVIGR